MDRLARFGAPLLQGGLGIEAIAATGAPGAPAGSGVHAQKRNLERGAGGAQGFVECRERRRAPEREFEISGVIEREIEAVGEPPTSSSMHARRSQDPPQSAVLRD